MLDSCVIPFPLTLLLYFPTLLTYLLTTFFQREFREICISFGWQRNGTSAAAGDADDAGGGGTGDANSHPNPNPNPNSNPNPNPNPN